ncbi:WD40 repeat-like protein [Pholiota conissans]|uniref:WD40 repeat-like protein n=1 Tax=Pholiota conissans TaxID=109636 RepID=A0A9P6CTV3_9AGAR|nr:WD40 repeat-like protein [Pholiota conissans]
MPSDDLPEYTLCTELAGSRGPVNALLFSEDKSILVSGGDDESIHVWNTTTYKHEFSFHNDQWGQVTALAWVFIDAPIDDKCTILAVGCGRGCVCLVGVNKGRLSRDAKTTTVFAFNDAVEAIAYDRINSKMAITSHSGQVKMFAVDKMSLKLLWTANMNNAIPRAVFFHGPSNSLLMTLGLETGEICCREVESANSLWKKTLNGPIGSAALSSDQGTLLVDNLANRSFDIYTIPSNSRTASLPFSATSRFTKQCTFSEGARIAVCGSVVNKVYIVDVTTNEILQTLVAGDAPEMMQTVAATDGSRMGALIAGGSNKGGIYLWQRMNFEKQDDENAEMTQNPSPPSESQPYGHEPINPQVVFLVLILTYGNWSPYLWQFVATMTAAFQSALQDLRSLLKIWITVLPPGANFSAFVVPPKILSRGQLSRYSPAHTDPNFTAKPTFEDIFRDAVSRNQSPERNVLCQPQVPMPSSMHLVVRRVLYTLERRASFQPLAQRLSDTPHTQRGLWYSPRVGT